MSYVIPNGFSRVTFEFQTVSTLGSKPVFGFGVSTNPGDTLLDAMQAWWMGSAQEHFAKHAILERIVARNDTMLEERLVGEDGNNMSPFGPPSNAALVSLTSGLAGRSNRGRIYLPFVLPENQLDGGGVIDPAQVAILQTMVDQLRTDIALALGEMVILHSNSSDPTPVTGALVSNVSATQRRRLRA